MKDLDMVHLDNVVNSESIKMELEEIQEKNIENFVVNSKQRDDDDQIISNGNIKMELQEIDESSVNQSSADSELYYGESLEEADMVKEFEGYGMFKHNNKNSENDMSMPKIQNKTAQCALCKEQLDFKFLQDHILQEHCDNQIIECALCEYKSYSSDALRDHFKVHQDEKSTCDLCNRNFKDLGSHIKYFHDRIRDHQYTFCKKKFQQNNFLDKHVPSIPHGTKIRCADCNKDISIDNITRHRKEKHEMVKKPCPFCEKEFAMSNLSRHIRGVHDNETQKCPQCDQSCSISNLKNHIKSVHQKLTKTCDLCNEVVPVATISTHKRKFHNIGKAIDDITRRGPNGKSGKKGPRGPQKARMYQSPDTIRRNSKRRQDYLASK